MAGERIRREECIKIWIKSGLIPARGEINLVFVIRRAIRILYQPFIPGYRSVSLINANDNSSLDSAS